MMKIHTWRVSIWPTSLNHRENIFGLKLNQRVFTSTVIYANYEMSDYRFAVRSERDARAQTMAVGVEFPEIGVLQGSFQIGLKRFEPENPLFQERAAPQRPRRCPTSPCIERLRFNRFL